MSPGTVDEFRFGGSFLRVSIQLRVRTATHVELLNATQMSEILYDENEWSLRLLCLKRIPIGRPYTTAAHMLLRKSRLAHSNTAMTSRTISSVEPWSSWPTRIAAL